MDLRIERQATQASVISEECAVVWGVRNHALIPLPLDGPERGRCVHWTTQSGKVWHCLEKTLPKLTHLLLALLTFLSVILHRTVGFPLSLVFAVPTDVWYFVSKSLSSREKNYNVGESHQVPG